MAGLQPPCLRVARLGWPWLTLPSYFVPQAVALAPMSLPAATLDPLAFPWELGLPRKLGLPFAS